MVLLVSRCISVSFTADLTLLDSGCAVVTVDAAYLFTDGRYFIQAEKQLDKLRTVPHFSLLSHAHETLIQQLEINEDGSSGYLLFTERTYIQLIFRPRCPVLAGFFAQGMFVATHLANRLLIMVRTSRNRHVLASMPRC